MNHHHKGHVDLLILIDKQIWHDILRGSPPRQLTTILKGSYPTPIDTSHADMAALLRTRDPTKRSYNSRDLFHPTIHGNSVPLYSSFMTKAATVPILRTPDRHPHRSSFLAALLK